MYYTLTFSGPFGFIKPWTAVRDELTFSQQFLTPSIIEGMRQKLEVSNILRHRLTYKAISIQQEVVHTRGWKVRKKEKRYDRPRAILKRGVLLNPSLTLAFPSLEDAQKASRQHLCLCRNEDVLIPAPNIQEETPEAFQTRQGFELMFEPRHDAFMVGYNRFQHAQPMYGWIYVSDKPLKNEESV
ncbi:MAG: hypothetical protein AAFW00_27265 [Bacteroidota bacterium]